MPIAERDRSIIEHMLSYCVRIEQYRQHYGDSFEDFERKGAYQDTCAFCILQIGELAVHLSSEFRKEQKEINWREVRELRNVIAHAYASIDLRVTWVAIKKDIPNLKTFCEKYLNG